MYTAYGIITLYEWSCSARPLSFILLQESLLKISPLANTMLISKEMKYQVIDCAINDTFNKISSLYGFPQQKPSVLHCSENSYSTKNNLCLSQCAYETGMLAFR